MKVSIVGATGVLGREMAPLFLESGFDVQAIVREPERAAWLQEIGVEVRQGDLLSEQSPEQLAAILKGSQVVVHAATAIPRDSSVPGAWQANSRLRTEGTRLLLDASLLAGVEKYIQQSIVMAYPDGNDRWLDESTPFDTSPARAGLVGPISEMEGMVREVPGERMSWCILRGGLFVGPGTMEDALIERIRRGIEVVPCDGHYFVSNVRVAGMARAFVIAAQKAPHGSIFNVVDEPVIYGHYVDTLAESLGVAPPARDASVSCPPSHRCSNLAIRRALGWEPVHL